MNKHFNLVSLPTFYRGHKFRSRLEARYAVYFDALSIDWRYEYEAYSINGRFYLPDFVLPNVSLRDFGSPCFIEIKPSYELYDSWERSFGVDCFDGFNLCVFVGDHVPGRLIQHFPYWDEEMAFMRCYKCGFTKIEYLESNYAVCKDCRSKMVILDEYSTEVQVASAAAYTVLFYKNR